MNVRWELKMNESNAIIRWSVISILIPDSWKWILDKVNEFGGFSMKSNSCQWAAHDSRCTCTMKCTPISFWFDPSKWKQPTTTTATFPNAQQTKKHHCSRLYEERSNDIITIWHQTGAICNAVCTLISKPYNLHAFACFHHTKAMDLFVTIIYLHNQIIGCYSPCFVFLLAFFWYFFRSFSLLKTEEKKSRTKIRTSLTYKLLWYSVTADIADFIIALEFYFWITVIDILLKNEPICLQNGISRVFKNGFVTSFLFYFKIDGNFFENSNQLLWFKIDYFFVVLHLLFFICFLSFFSLFYLFFIFISNRTVFFALFMFFARLLVLFIESSRMIENINILQENLSDYRRTLNTLYSAEQLTRYFSNLHKNSPIIRNWNEWVCHQHVVLHFHTKLNKKSHKKTFQVHMPLICYEPYELWWRMLFYVQTNCLFIEEKKLTHFELIKIHVLQSK